MGAEGMPYWRLSSFYLFYFATLGVLVPYWALYLKHLNFNAAEIGELMAILMLTKVVSPNVWGWIADHTGKRMQIVRIGSFLALVTFALVFLVEQYWPLAMVMLLYSFFWNAALPQFESVTLGHLLDETHRYSFVRLWGSIGFIVAVVALGEMLDRQSAAILPAVLMMMFLGIWLSSLLVPEKLDGGQRSESGSIMNVLRKPAVIALLLVCFLMQASHGPYYTFYTIYMESHGYGRGMIGQLWALGVIAEVGIFMVMHRLVLRYGLRVLLITSLLLTAMRWFLIGYLPDNLPVMLFAQLLHAASFAVFHAVAIQLFHHFFRGAHHGRGQALYASFSFGAGGAVGAFYSGAGWDTWGPTWVYSSAGYMALLAALVAYAMIRLPASESRV